MNKHILAALIAGGFAVNGLVMADHEHGHKMGDKKDHHQKKMEELFEAVDATDAQKTQIRAIHEKYHTQMQGMEKDMWKAKHDLMDYVLSPGATQAEAQRRHEAMLENKQRAGELMLQAAFEKKAVLTPEQQAEARAFFAQKAEDKADKHEDKAEDMEDEADDREDEAEDKN